jgi:hypothetical protein
MKTKISILFFLIACAFFVKNAGAQNPVAHLGATATYLNTDQAALDTMPIFILLMEERSITLNVVMGNTNGVSKIAAAIGSSEGSNDLFYKEFEYGTEGNFQDGTTYQAQGNTIDLGVGNYAGAAVYYAEVFVIKEDGTRGEGKRVEIQ